MKKSSFINILAWSTIILSMISLIAYILQSIAFGMFASNSDIGLILSQIDEMPIIDNLEAPMMLNLVFMTISLVAGIGLLKRQNWARILFIIFSLIGILWTLFSGYVLFSMTMEMIEIIPDDTVMSGPTILIAMVIVLQIWLLAYIIKKLVSSDIQREFD